MRIDVNCFVGRYPFRGIGAGPEHLLAEMDGAGIDTAWVSNLSAMFWRDPTTGNGVLYDARARSDRLIPVPAVHPQMANWEQVLDDAVAARLPAVRADPVCYGVAPDGAEMLRLCQAIAERDLVLQTAVRLEDVRQRHPNDTAGELTPAAARRLIRSNPRLRILITHADRDFIEQVHFGATPSEAARLLWDICWIWGPPEDHLALLLDTVGSDRFAFGTGLPLRLAENTLAKLELLECSADGRQRIDAGNVTAFVSAGLP
jgi:hypothetical protein